MCWRFASEGMARGHVGRGEPITGEGEGDQDNNLQDLQTIALNNSLEVAACAWSASG